ncbi:hypothetical protein LTR95_019582, partial [Oleoguttula sp. CCFEE 5521]
MNEDAESSSRSPLYEQRDACKATIALYAERFSSSGDAYEDQPVSNVRLQQI